MKACVLHGIGDLRYEDVPTPQPAAGEVRLRVVACGVCGSDISRIFQKGTYRFPLIPGHEFAGTGEAAGPGVDAGVIGKPYAVFPLIPCRRCGPCNAGAYAQCEKYDYVGSRRDGAFAEFVCVPEWNLVPVPPGLSFEEAALCEPAAVAAHAVRQVSIVREDAVLVFGAGPIGIMAADWARKAGAGRIVLCDIDEVKLAHARGHGYSLLIHSTTDGLVGEWLSRHFGRGADVVIEASGSPQAFEQAMMAAGPFGRIILIGNPAGDMNLAPQAYSAILRKELKIYGTWNSHPKTDWSMVLHAMADGTLKLRSLISHRVALQDVPAVLAMMRDRTESYSKVMYVSG